ncbi:MAG: hypothetical protein K0Q94_3914 [Paenibacillus sp.]|jgi:thiol-disulfide isomerase/thioredoxin|nr:hypothetical protein [Paenibacillus sp.]
MSTDKPGITSQRRERAFREAVSYRQFVESAQVNADRLNANYEAYRLTGEEQASLAEIPEPIDVLVLAHDWCGDVVANLPLFARIEQETGKLKLRILPRDPDNRDIAESYAPADGRSRIPTYIFFDQAGRELGVFIERPDSITELNKIWGEQFWDEHPEWDGRGRAPSELEETVRKAYFAFLMKEKRPTVRDREKQAIIEKIKSIAAAGA